MKNFLICTVVFIGLAALAGFCPALAQVHLLSCTVKDAATGETIPYAHVKLSVTGHDLYTTTDEHGQFHFNVMKGRTIDGFQITHIGYHSKTVAPITQDVMEVTLEPDTRHLSTVDVIAPKTDPHQLLREVLDAYKEGAYKTTPYVFDYNEHWWMHGDTFGHIVSQVRITPKKEAEGKLLNKNNANYEQFSFHSHQRRERGMLFQDANGLENNIIGRFNIEDCFPQFKKRRVELMVDSILINGVQKPVIHIVYYPKDKHIGSSVCTVDLETHALLRVSTDGVSFSETITKGQKQSSQTELYTRIEFNGEKMPMKIEERWTSYSLAEEDMPTLVTDHFTKMECSTRPAPANMAPVDFSKSMFMQGAE